MSPSRISKLNFQIFKSRISIKSKFFHFLECLFSKDGREALLVICLLACLQIYCIIRMMDKFSLDGLHERPGLCLRYVGCAFDERGL